MIKTIPEDNSKTIKTYLHCGCGGKVLRKSLTQHLKTKKHLYFIENGFPKKKSIYAIRNSKLDDEDLEEKREYMKKYMKEYYKNHKKYFNDNGAKHRDIYKLSNMVKHQCKCGSSYASHSTKTHVVTKRHQRYLLDGTVWKK